MPQLQRFPNTPRYPLSRAIPARRFLLLSGQTRVDAGGQVVRGDIAAQAHAVLQRIGETLALAGAGYSDVVRATVWLAGGGVKTSRCPEAATSMRPRPVPRLARARRHAVNCRSLAAPSPMASGIRASRT